MGVRLKEEVEELGLRIHCSLGVNNLDHRGRRMRIRDNNTSRCAQIVKAVIIAR